MLNLIHRKTSQKPPVLRRENLGWASFLMFYNALQWPGFIRRRHDATDRAALIPLFWIASKNFECKHSA
jgi:hypothetical protein